MKIGQLAKQSSVTIDTIRYYEKRQLMPKPQRTSAQYRNYAADDVKRLLFITHAKELGFTLEEIKTLLSLRSNNVECVQVRTIAKNKAAEIAARIKHLARMEEVLLQLADKCAKQDNDQCPILKSLEGKT
ncbi:MAG: heavy metal-responsive transcriptional regulator [Mariprofundales bacterium]